MIKKFGILIVLIVFVLSNVGALTLNMKSDYSQSETGLAKISGDIQNPISRTNVEFYRGHVLVSSFDYGVVKIGLDYYVWFVTPNIKNNYTLKINNANLAQNFSVGSSKADYYFKPGAVISDSDFSINLFSNIDWVEDINIVYVQSQNKTIYPGSNKLDFSLGEISSTSTINMMVGSYTMPAYLIKRGSVQSNNSNSSNSTIETGLINITFIPKQIKREEAVESILNYTVQLFNPTNSIINDIEINYNNKVLSLDKNLIEEIPANSSVSLNIRVLTSANVSEAVLFVKGNESVNFPVEVFFVNGINTTSQNKLLYDCTSEMGGKMCLPSEMCTGNVVQSKQGSCCIGNCASNNSAGSKSSSWIGWLIALVVLGIIGFSYYKYKEVKPAENPLGNKVKEIEKKDLAPKIIKK